MTESNKTPLIIAFVAVVVLFLVFGGGTMMNGRMMGQGWTGGFGRMWIPTLLMLGLGIVLGWLIFGRKN